MTITAEQMTKYKLSAHQKIWAGRWNEQVRAWNATVGPVMQRQIDKMVASQDLALVAALTDIVRIIRGEAPMNDGQGWNTSTKTGGIGGEPISTMTLQEPTGETHKKTGQPITIGYNPIWSYRFPYLNNTRLGSDADGIWRVILDSARQRLLGIYDYHGAGLKPWNGEGITTNTAS